MAVVQKLVGAVETVNDKTAGYKTYIAAILVAVFGILQGVNWETFFTDPKAGSVAIFTAVLFAILRTFTKTPPLQGVVKNPEENK